MKWNWFITFVVLSRGRRTLSSSNFLHKFSETLVFLLSCLWVNWMKSRLNFFLVLSINDLRWMRWGCLQIDSLFQNSVVLFISNCWILSVRSSWSLSWLSSLFNERCEFVLSFKFSSLNAWGIDCDLYYFRSIWILFLRMINLGRFKSHVSIQILSWWFNYWCSLLIHR